MNTHHCRTGHHPEPASSCHRHHRCRCGGCVDAKNAQARAERAERAAQAQLETEADADSRMRACRRPITVPTRVWDDLVAYCRTVGITTDDLLRDIAATTRKASRL